MNLAIYSPNWIGDAVLALPFLAACRQRHPKARITIIAKAYVADIYRQHPAVDGIEALEPAALSGLWATAATGRRLKALSLDKIYLLSDSFRAAWMARLSGSRERIGYGGQGRGPLLTRIVAAPTPQGHRADRYLALLEGGSPVAEPRTAGITLSASETAWAAEELDGLSLKEPLAVFTGSVAPARQVPLEKWAAFLKPFASAGKPLLLLGSDRDRDLARAVTGQLPAGSALSVCGDYTLRQSMALISRCQGALAADSGLGHVAANLGLATVSIFGSEDPRRTRPLGARTAVVRKPVHCSPCRKNICHNRDEPLLCLQAIADRRLWEAYGVLQN